MSKASKKLLSFALVVMMIIAMVPAMGAGAEGTPVDLIQNSDKTLKEGVSIAHVGGNFNNDANTVFNKAFDGSLSTSWSSAWSPGKAAYAQVNFPVKHQITEIDVYGCGISADYRVAFDVYVSNDITFKSSVKVYSQAGGYSSGQKIAVTMTDTTPYQYVRVITTSTGLRFGIAELDVLGYQTALPDTSADTLLTSRPDVYATSINAYSSTWTAQRALDGNESTFFFASSTANGYFQLDLRRSSEISKIGFVARYDDNYAQTRKNYNILLSNDPTFGSGVLVYSLTDFSTAQGQWVYAYVSDETPYRYVRIQKNTASDTQISVAEIKVWGTEKYESLQVEELAKTSTVSATSEGTSATSTIDGSVTSYWLNWNDTGKASITYTFTEPKMVTSVAIYPMYDTTREDRLMNMNIYASVDGTFADQELFAVIDKPMTIGQFNNFTADAIKNHKAIRIESTKNPTEQTGMGFCEIMIVSDNSDVLVDVETASPANGATGVTNIDSLDNVIEVTLNRSVNADTITPENIIITNKANSTVFSDWQAYSVKGKTFNIDIAGLSSSTEYEVKLTTGVKAGNLPLAKEYTFSFTTGTIFNVPYVEGKVIKNVALGKTAVTKSGNYYSPYVISNMTDGNYSTFGHTNPGETPNILIDLGNIYDVIAIEVQAQGVAKDMQVLGSIGNIYGDEMTRLFTTVVMGDNGNTDRTMLAASQRARYIGVYRNNTTFTSLREVKIYAYVSEDFGAWSVTKDRAEATEITGAGEYTFSIPVTNYIDSDSTYYMLIGAYDATGAMVTLNCETVEATAGVMSTISQSIFVDDRAESIRAMIIKGKSDTRMLVNMKEITKPAVVQ